MGQLSRWEPFAGHEQNAGQSGPCQSATLHEPKLGRWLAEAKGKHSEAPCVGTDHDHRPRDPMLPVLLAGLWPAHLCMSTR